MNRRVVMDNSDISITIKDNIVLLEAHLECSEVKRGGYISQEIKLSDLLQLIEEYKKKVIECDS